MADLDPFPGYIRSSRGKNLGSIMKFTSSPRSRAFRPYAEHLELLSPVSSLSGIAAFALAGGEF